MLFMLFMFSMHFPRKLYNLTSHWSLCIELLPLFVEWSFHFIINWSCQLVLQSCELLQLFKFCFVDFQLLRNILISFSTFSDFYAWWKKGKKKSKNFYRARKCRNNGEKFSEKYVQKKLFHTSLYFNSCKIINFYTASKKNVEIQLDPAK